MIAIPIVKLPSIFSNLNNYRGIKSISIKCSRFNIKVMTITICLLRPILLIDLDAFLRKKYFSDKFLKQ